VILGFFIVLSGSLAVGSIGGFLNLYLVCKGNESLNGNLVGLTLTVMSLVSYISMFMLTFVSRLKGKREAFMLGMVITTIGQLSLWFTIDPRWPYLQLVSLGFWALAMQGCWLMLDSMLSDICDDDERETGHRREGMFGAVRGFIQKASQALMALISGFMLKFTGFDAETAKTAGLDPAIALRMKLLYVLIPAAGFLLGLVVFYFYPISRERAAETRRILDERNAKTKA
ncbi:MAG: MFS transporter, partial [Victivallales bacterium]|nr:MFS transporter [Victivallales bacterium]